MCVPTRWGSRPIGGTWPGPCRNASRCGLAINLTLLTTIRVLAVPAPFAWRGFDADHLEQLTQALCPACGPQRYQPDHRFRADGGADWSERQRQVDAAALSERPEHLR